MAYKVSYKVVAQQGEQLKKIAKDMDNYISQLSQITGNLGGDELLVNVRNDLKKFSRQLEEEKTVLNLAGQVITDVLQSYTNVEKKSVQKVDRAKAHNRDFYKRPVAVASAGAVATASASATATATAYASGGQTTNINVNNTVINQEVTNNFAGAAGDFASAGPMGQGSSGIMSGLGNIDVDPSVVATAAVAGMAAVGGAAAAQSIKDKKEEKKQKKLVES